MGCFTVPAVEAVVVTAATKIAEKKEAKAAETGCSVETTSRFPLSQKLKWLSKLLWGGTFLLMFEHIWHGELVPWFPFLTAASDPASLAEMLYEMMTAGVAMALLVTAVWGCMLLAVRFIERRTQRDEQQPAGKEAVQ